MAKLDNPSGRIGGGRAVCTTAGTANVIVTTNVPCSWVIIQAETDNAGNVMIGDSSVDITDTSQTNGIILDAGESITLPISDLGELYIDSGTSGDGITYLYGSD